MQLDVRFATREQLEQIRVKPANVTRIVAAQVRMRAAA